MGASLYFFSRSTPSTRALIEQIKRGEITRNGGGVPDAVKRARETFRPYKVKDPFTGEKVDVKVSGAGLYLNTENVVLRYEKPDNADEVKLKYFIKKKGVNANNIQQRDLRDVLGNGETGNIDNPLIAKSDYTLKLRIEENKDIHKHPEFIEIWQNDNDTVDVKGIGVKKMKGNVYKVVKPTSDSMGEYIIDIKSPNTKRDDYIYWEGLNKDGNFMDSWWNNKSMYQDMWGHTIGSDHLADFIAANESEDDIEKRRLRLNLEMYKLAYKAHLNYEPDLSDVKSRMEGFLYNFAKIHGVEIKSEDIILDRNRVGDDEYKNEIKNMLTAVLPKANHHIFVGGGSPFRSKLVNGYVERPIANDYDHAQTLISNYVPLFNEKEYFGKLKFATLPLSDVKITPVYRTFEVEYDNYNPKDCSITSDFNIEEISNRFVRFKTDTPYMAYSGIEEERKAISKVLTPKDIEDNSKSIEIPIVHIVFEEIPRNFYAVHYPPYVSSPNWRLNVRYSVLDHIEICQAP